MNNAPAILIVDDNAPFRHLMAAFLKKAGYLIVQAEEGHQALELLRSLKIDVILLDLQMLPMGGFAFMEEYSQMGYQVPVLLVTGDESSDILTVALKMGFVGVLKKPVSESRVVQMVERALFKAK